MNKIKSILAFAALMLCGGAWAATPIAEWAGDFSIKEKGSGTVTFKLNDNAAIGDHAISITDTTGPVFVQRINSEGTASSNYKKVMTVVLRYSQYPTLADGARAPLLTILNNYNNANAISDGDKFRNITGLCGNKDGRMSEIWGSYAYQWDNNPADLRKCDRVALIYNSGSGPILASGDKYGIGMAASPLGAKNRYTDGFLIGGIKSCTNPETSLDATTYKYNSKGALSTANGLVVTGIAVFDENVSSYDLRDFRFSDEGAGSTPLSIYNGNNGSESAETWSTDAMDGYTYKFLIPASSSMPDGTIVNVKRVTFGCGSTYHTGNIPLTIKIGSYVSGMKNGTGVNNDSHSYKFANNSFYEAYYFPGPGVEVEVGKEYPFSFHTDVYGSGVKSNPQWYRITPGAGKVTVITESKEGWTDDGKRATQEVLYTIKSAPCFIGETKYETLAAALESNTATAETPIKIYNDEDLPSTITAGTYYIDTNGHQLNTPKGLFSSISGVTVTVASTAGDAAEASMIWNRDFSSGRVDKNGNCWSFYDPNSVSRSATGATIGSSGGVNIVNRTKNPTGLSGIATVIFRAKNIALPSSGSVVLARLKQGNTTLGASLSNANGAGYYTRVWTDNNLDWSSRRDQPAVFASPGVEQTYVLAYEYDAGQNKGTYFYRVDGERTVTKLWQEGGLESSGITAINEISILGKWGGNSCNGATVTGLAIFEGTRLTEEGIANFNWKSPAPNKANYSASEETVAHYGYIPATASLIWPGLTLNDIKDRIFAGTMNGAWVAADNNAGNGTISGWANKATTVEKTVSDDAIVLDFKADAQEKYVRVTLANSEDGVTAVAAAGTTKGGTNSTLATDDTAQAYGIKVLTATAPVARANGNSYLTLAEAITAAADNGEVELLRPVSEAITLNKSVALKADSDVSLSGTITTTAGKTLTKTGAGKLTLSAANNYNCAIVVSAGTLHANAADQGLKGNITIAAGAKFINGSTDGLNYNGTVNVHVYGTLDMDLTRWSMGNNNHIYLYPGSNVIGQGESDAQGAITNGALDNNNSDQTLIHVVKNGEEGGTATFDSNIRFRGTGRKTGIEIADGMTLEYASTYGFISNTGTLVLTGGGEFNITSEAILTKLTAIELGDGVTVKVAEGKTVTFAEPSSGKYIAVTNNDDGSKSYTLKNLVATITVDGVTTNFDSITDAIAAAQAGQTVAVRSTVTDNITIPSGKIVATTVSAKVTGTISGSGRIVIEGDGSEYTTADPAITLADDWTGTVELKNLKKATSTQFGVIHFNNYVKTGSKLALNGVTSSCHADGTVYGGVNYQKISAAEIELIGDGLTLRHGAFSSTDYFTGNLTGSGALTITGTGDSQGQVCFKGDHSEFTGSVTVADANKTKRIVFMPADADDLASSTDWKKIVVAEGALVNIGSTWTAPNGIFINGTIKGSGTLTSNVTFGSTATIDMSAGAVTAQGTVTFGDKLTIKNPELDGVVLKKTSEGDFTGTPNVGLGYKLAKDDENIKYVRDFSLWSANKAIFTKISGANWAYDADKVDIYDIAGNTTATDVPMGGTARQLPGRTDSINPWLAFTTASTGKYVAPGYVMRLTETSHGNSESSYTMDIDFPQLRLGGLIVEKGTHDFSITGSGDRTTYFGDNRSNNQKVPTYFEINENLTIKREGETRFYGTETWTIADGKTFSINAVQGFTNRATVFDAGTAANVKILGGGQIAVSTLTATGAVTLDLSDQDVARETPVIVGTLTVDGSTTIKLPATMQVNETMKVASSISGELTQGKILLGSTATDEILWVIDAANGTITATAAPAAMIGETKYDTLALAITAANEQVAGGAASVTITLARSNAEAANLGEKVTLDTASRTYTGAVTGSGTIKYANFTVSNETKASLTQAGWTGTFLVDGFNNMTGQDLNQFGRTGSKVELKNVTGYFTSNKKYNPEVVISGTFSQNSGYSGNWNEFTKLSGTGKFVSASGKPSQNYFVTDWSNFTGDLEMYAGAMIFGTRGSKNDYSATIRIESGSSVTLSDNTWAANSMTVEGTLKGTGTINAPVTLGSTGVLDTTAGILNVTSVEVASGATIKLSTTPAGDVKVMNFTATKNMPITAAVTVKVGEETLSGYGLAQKTDGLYVIQQKTLEWQGASGAAITDSGVWTNGTYADNSEYGIFTMPAQDSQVVIHVPAGTADVSYITIAEGGNYKFVGEGQDWKIGVFNAAGATVSFENIKVDIDTTDITSEGAMKALVGTGAHVAIPHEAITLASGATLTLKAGLTYKLPIVPTLNNEATITIENASALQPGVNYALLSWTKQKSASSGYGKPQLDVTGYVAPEGAPARLIPCAYALYLQLRSAEQMARKPLTIMPFGDSITEGMNTCRNRANYRVQLFQKLSLAGYNVKSVGFHRRTNADPLGAYDPSGNVVTDEDWDFHSGVGSERLQDNTGKNGALYDSWANALDQAGDPDIILLHIGINDTPVNSNAGMDAKVEPTANGLIALVKKILVERPNSVLVMSSMNRLEYGQTFQKSATPGAEQDGNHHWVIPVRNKLLEFFNGVKDGSIECEGGDRLYFADMCDKIRPRSYATFQEGENEQDGLFDPQDHIHPDWSGHDIMAQTWFDEIVKAFPLSDGSTYHENNKVATAHKHGAINNVPDAYMTGFKKARVLTPKENGLERAGTLVVTNPHEIADDQAVEKIGYYVEYEFPSATTNIHRWVWVDMDAFGTAKTVVEAGLPTSGTTEKLVSSLHVASNHPQVYDVLPTDNTVKGIIEFSPYKPTTGTGTSEAGAPGHWFGSGTAWNDGVNTAQNYGSMQVHRVFPQGSYDNNRPAQILFVYNAWNCADDEKATEFGIGSFGQHFLTCSVDWINMRDSETMHSGKLTAKSIEIWVKPVEAEGQIDVDPAQSTEVEATDADDAISKVTLVVSDAKADELGQSALLKLEAKETSEGSGRWTVSAVVDKDATVSNTSKTVQTAVEETAVEFAQQGLESIAGATETTHVDIPAAKVVPGLYYSVSYGTTPDNHTQESKRVLATGSDVTIPVPALGNEKVYYIKIKASATTK